MLTKTEQDIMSEIQAKGYAVIEWGLVAHSGRRGLFGLRRAKAANSLCAKNLAKVTHSGKDQDAHRGRTSTFHYMRLERP